MDQIIPKVVPIAGSFTKCGITQEEWVDMLRGIQQDIDLDENIIGLEGLSKHGQAWENWLDWYLDGPLRLRYWNIPSRDNVAFARDINIIRDVFRTAISSIASARRAEIAKFHVGNSKKSTRDIARLARLADIRAIGEHLQTVEGSSSIIVPTPAATAPSAIIPAPTTIPLTVPSHPLATAPTSSERAAAQVSKALQNLEKKKREASSFNFRVRSAPQITYSCVPEFGSNNSYATSQLHNTIHVYTKYPIVPATTSGKNKRARSDSTPASGFQITSQARQIVKKGDSLATNELSQVARAINARETRVDTPTFSTAQVNASQGDHAITPLGETASTYPTSASEHETELTEDPKDQPPAKRQRIDITITASKVSETIEEDSYEPPGSEDIELMLPLNSIQPEPEIDHEDAYTPPPASPCSPFSESTEMEDHNTTEAVEAEIVEADVAIEMQDEIPIATNTDTVERDEPDIQKIQQDMLGGQAVGDLDAAENDKIYSSSNSSEHEKQTNSIGNEITINSHHRSLPNEVRDHSTRNNALIDLVVGSFAENMSLTPPEDLSQPWTFATCRFDPQQQCKSDYLFLRYATEPSLDGFLNDTSALHTLGEDERIKQLRVGIGGDWVRLCESSGNWIQDWSDVTEIMVNKGCKVDVIFEAM